VIRGSRMGLSTATPAAFFLFFLLMFLGQPLLRAMNPRWAFRRGEALTVMCMMMVATALPTRRVAWGLGMITGTHYWGNASNGWPDTVWPHVTEGLAVSDAAAVRAFYEGAESAGQAPWAGFVAPLLMWALFLLSFHLTIICLMSILRKQWVENEKLAYPVNVVPLEMVADPEPGRRLCPFFRNRLMWLGFAVPFVLESINALHRYHPGRFPAVPLMFGHVFLFGRSTWVTFRLNFLLFGLAYFIETRLLFSMVLFYWVLRVARGYMTLLGVQSVYLGYWTDGAAGGLFAYLTMGP
jgi:hypothetical protein